VKDLSNIADRLHFLAVPLKTLSHDPQNARRHSKRNLDAVRASLEEHGQVKPVVAMPDGTVIAGNGTLEAARSLGWEYLAVVTFMGDAHAARRYGVQDNRTAELADWDDDALASILSDMRTEDADLEALGFSDVELDRLLAEAVPLSLGTTDPNEEYRGMPDFEQPEASGIRMVIHFANQEDRSMFAKLIGQEFTPKTRSIWFPAVPWDRASKEVYE